jgi:hypothetical protein
VVLPGAYSAIFQVVGLQSYLLADSWILASTSVSHADGSTLFFLQVAKVNISWLLFELHRVNRQTDNSSCPGLLA